MTWKKIAGVVAIVVLAMLIFRGCGDGRGVMGDHDDDQYRHTRVFADRAIPDQGKDGAVDGYLRAWRRDVPGDHRGEAAGGVGSDHGG